MAIHNRSACLLTAISLVLAACGGGGGGGSNTAVAVAPPAPQLASFAGSLTGTGNVDGSGASARFNALQAVAADSAGNVYVADTSNNTIRKISAAGVTTTVAGLAGNVGNANGAGAAARFSIPSGIAVDSAGNIYVADSGNHVIRQITTVGTVSNFAGVTNIPGSTDGSASNARFNYPTGLTIDAAGNLYVSETGNNTIRKITPTGSVSTLAGTAGVAGSSDGTGGAASFKLPSAVAVDTAGNVYVADTNNSTVRKITATGVVTTLAGTAGTTGSVDGAGSAARFGFLRGIAVDASGNVYVGDTSNDTIRKITSAGNVTTLAGTAILAGSTDASGNLARFNDPRGLAVDSAGNILVADTQNHAVRKISATAVVTTFAGAAANPGYVDGVGAAAGFSSPRGLAADSAGNVYVVDFLNHTIRKISPAGNVTVFAGAALQYGSVDGTAAAARFFYPYSVAADTNGNLFISDYGNNTIRKIAPGGAVTTLAGLAGASGSVDGSGAAARFASPVGIAVDSTGNVYVGDAAAHTIRKITPAGVATTFAGLANVTGSVDGTGAAARFFSPLDVAVDNAGNIYVADTNNSVIRKITSAGVVSTFAGTANTIAFADGVGAAASFNKPQGVATDAAGNVYVADTNNHVIRKITPAGVVSTVVGTPGKASFVAGALPGLLAYPQDVTVTGSSLYIIMADGVAVVTNLP